MLFQAFLSNEDLGDSLDSVEALIKKHEDFEKSLAAQEEKIKVSTLKNCVNKKPTHQLRAPFQESQVHIELNLVRVFNSSHFSAYLLKHSLVSLRCNVDATNSYREYHSQIW